MDGMTLTWVKTMIKVKIVVLCWDTNTDKRWLYGTKSWQHSGVNTIDYLRGGLAKYLKDKTLSRLHDIDTSGEVQNKANI